MLPSVNKETETGKKDSILRRLLSSGNDEAIGNNNTDEDSSDSDECTCTPSKVRRIENREVSETTNAQGIVSTEDENGISTSSSVEEPTKHAILVETETVNLISSLGLPTSHIFSEETERVSGSDVVLISSDDDEIEEDFKLYLDEEDED